MSNQSVRQSELFSAEDWRVIYRAFTEVNFNGYDFDTVKSSMIDYIRFNFPEDFNDWIESSEFVALIDLVAYFGQLMAFRMDINSQENFIDNVERKESILRIARMLSYVPSRNTPARGLAKIVQIKTDEPLVDSLGTTLQNQTIEWDDPNNPDWFEQFILILNSAFINTNPYGKPVKNGTVSSISTNLYQIDTVPTNVGQYGFTASVDNTQYSFEAVNPTFDTVFTERNPDPLYSYHLIQRNDGNGNSSANTGFFVFFKQGKLSFEDFQIDVPLENRIIDVSASNINQFDVFVQTINSDTTVQTEWTQVPAVVGNNVIFNSLNSNVKDIYSVISKDNDKISLRFADGVFGTVPTGTLRVYYRTSANEVLNIQPKDIKEKTITIPYSSNNKTYNLTLTFSLQNSVQNSSKSETLESIRLRAPQVYYTQNRMVNGEDYNVFPLQSSEILKLKAMNREYSGHSRFIDINSPTSTSQDVNVFADDGMVYREFDDNLDESPLSDGLTSGEIVSTLIHDALKNLELSQFFYNKYSKFSISEDSPTILWESATSAKFSSTGQFTDTGGNDASTVADNYDGTALGTTQLVDHATTSLTDPANFITEGALIEFLNGKWVTATEITENGNGFFDSGKGRVTLNENILTNDQIISVFPAFRTSLTSAEATLIIAELDNQNTFGIRYDHTDTTWKIISSPNLAPASTDFSLTYAGDISLTNLDASWLLRCDFLGDRWRITTRGLRYVFESEQDVRFFVNQFYKVSSAVTGKSSRDTLQVLETETKPGSNSVGLGQRIIYSIKDMFRYSDGYEEPRRVQVGFNDSDSDGVPDDPEIFEKTVLVDPNGDTIDAIDQYVFHKKLTDQFGYEYFEIDKTITKTLDIVGSPPSTSNLSDGDILFSLHNLSFYSYDSEGDDFTILSDQTEYEYLIGRNDMDFLWKHVADKTQRIDPTSTNIIDTFVLTTSYDTEYRRYIAKGDTTATEPLPPTPLELKTSFGSYEDYAMVSDEIIWKPVRYKTLFGTHASEELKATFKVVKVMGTDVSDDEIKTRVVSAINNFFSVNNFDFGDTFFASELIAYIHIANPTVIAGIELVPLNEESRFGKLQQIKSEPDEIFISSATVSDVEIVKAYTDTILRVNA